MRRREPLEVALDQLGSEASSVLAVLVMAALWPGRYASGWVSVGEFARAGVLLGDRADRESLKAAIRRGLQRVACLPGAPAVQCRRTLDQNALTARARRDRDRRLTEPPGQPFQAWLLKSGSGLIAPELWRLFFPVHSTALGSSGPAARDLLRQSLREAESCLGFAALVISPWSPEGLTLRRIRQVVSEGVKTLADD